MTPDPARAERPLTRFDVWAPRASRVRLHVAGQVVPMRPVADRAGWWTPDAPVPDGEVDYGYLLDDAETPRPDPRSRRQPDGVHALSRTDDPAAFAWTDRAWTGRQLAGAMIYELHLGTFTPEGTLDAAITRLPHLRDLGVDLVELLPVNGFNGVHNWGYDGVLWFTVHEAYGGPEAYRRFVDAAHAHGLGVVQDVVHNHLGPSGNYLPEFGPYLKTGRNTWGDLVNLDGPDAAEVRRLILDDVAMWFRDFHVDALRLDAVHALHDDSPVHLLEEMAVETAALSAHLGRPLTLIAESDLNDPTLITPREAGGYGLDAQWSDDVHHAVHVALTGETTGYYADFEPLTALAKVLEGGFFHDGTWSSFRGREHGRPIDRATTPGWRLVVCSQNHDQIGNRAVGDRLTAHLDEDRLGCAALLILCSPFTPMLFMGEEWGATTPFCFFTSHPEPDLGEATARGRIEEFAAMGWDAAVVPDPQDPDTFARSHLDWSEAEHGRGARLLELYRTLGRLRRTEPALTDSALHAVRCEVDETTRVVRLHRGPLQVVVNLGEGAVVLSDSDAPAWEVLAATASVDGQGAGPLSLPPGSGVLVRT
ncbi:malto-oligosyltrehalose trehalohydrolase [Nocardioides sp.]|uniref:malto-oligosyltrehalose trehalohydrolase n=1 Tax=Nocardioides sp. TaxID=35761 RepID=UPI0035129687